MTSLPSYLQEPALEYRYQKLRNKKIWQPAPENEPQQLAYELAKSGQVMEIGYGGRAGGGKTDLALGLAGTAFSRTLMLRRIFGELSDVVDRGDEIYPVDFVGGHKKTWRFDEHVIGLASCQYENDWRKYRGRSIDLLIFDEAEEFLESQVRSISGWIRSPKGKNTLLLLCFNPPDKPEGEWIVKRFAPWVDPQYSGERAETGEIRWFARLDDDTEIEVDNGEIFEHEGKTVYPINRTFIPASRHDNPYLGEDYERRLGNMPEPLRTMLMEGDFTVGTEDDIWQVFPTLWILQAMERGRNIPKPDVALRSVGVDVARGGKDNTAIAKLYGNWFAPVISYLGKVTVNGETAAKLVLDNVETPAPIFVDVIGYGSSCYDVLAGTPNIEVSPINNGAGAGQVTDKSGRYQFANIRAASYWALREALDPANEEEICLPDDRHLRVELQSARWKIQSGKIKIEPKEDIIKRLGMSPDNADAIVMAWYGVNRPTVSIDWI